MKAYQLASHGKSNVLQIEDIPEPVCNPDQVKVKIKTIGINYAELLSRKGQYKWAPKMPYIPGMEAYGEVVETGKEVKTWKVGDKVITGSQYGSYAEYICIPEHLAFKPIENYTDAENASVLVNYMTAWVALFKLARIQTGDQVLIQAAAGGVGTAAVQLSGAAGAFVFGTASNSEKLDLIKSLGGNVAINYRKEDFASIVKKYSGGVDIVLEVVGGKVFKKSFECLNPFGKIVVAGYASIPMKKYNPFTWWLTWKNAPKLDVMTMATKTSGLMATHIGYLTADKNIASKEWQALRQYLINKNIKPIVGKQFTFDEIPQAHDHMESRKSMGKIVITVTE